MNCLKNYIQIEGCSAPAYNYSVDAVLQAPSGLFINKDLPISLEMMDKVADSEQKNFLGVWEEVQTIGLRKFKQRLKAGFKELFNECDLKDEWFCENRESLALPLLYFLGMELMFVRIYSTRINRYTTIDSKKAAELRNEFENQFTVELKSALEIIGAPKKPNNTIFDFIEVTP